jgi:hypothetical protein
MVARSTDVSEVRMSSRPAGPGSRHRCELTVTGPVAGAVLETMQSRFDAMATRHPGRTVVVARSVDQAAVRALMVMLWDSGHEVQAMSLTNDS